MRLTKSGRARRVQIADIGGGVSAGCVDGWRPLILAAGGNATGSVGKTAATAIAIPTNVQPWQCSTTPAYPFGVSGISSDTPTSTCDGATATAWLACWKLWARVTSSKATTKPAAAVCRRTFQNGTSRIDFPNKPRPLAVEDIGVFRRGQGTSLCRTMLHSIFMSLVHSGLLQRHSTRLASAVLCPSRRGSDRLYRVVVP